MGIESREYLKGDEEGPFSGGPGRAAPVSMVTKIIIATVAVFILQVLSIDRRTGISPVEEWFILNGEDLFSGQIWRLLTYGMLHSRQHVLHIAMNMYLLFILGRVTAQLTGEREFLWFYGAALVFAGICSVCFYQFFNATTNILGASGAVMAVFMLFTMHYPRQKLYLFGVLGIEVRWLLAAYALFDVLPVMRDLSTGRLGAGGVAHSAHLGGLIFGWLYFRWNMRLSTWWSRLMNRSATAARVKKAGLRVYNPESQPEPDLSERVDEILAKISEHGEESLTSRERRILRQASEQMKKRR